MRKQGTSLEPAKDDVRVSAQQMAGERRLGAGGYLYMPGMSAATVRQREQGAYRYFTQFTACDGGNRAASAPSEERKAM